MFSKLQRFSHLSSDRQPSDDDVATSRITTAPFLPKDRNPAADGDTVEVPHRKRGRPPGSKNKPKQQFGVSTGDPEPSDMSPYILEVAAGDDVVEAVSRFSRRKGTGLCILSASGTVANFTIRQPAASTTPTVTFNGRYDILSISATFLPHASSNYPVPNRFSISLSGPQGQLVGGTVAGPLMTAGPVFIVAVLLNNPSHHKLPADHSRGEEECWKSEESGDGGNTPPPESVGRSTYSCHMGSDVIWTSPSGSRHY